MKHVTLASIWFSIFLFTNTVYGQTSISGMCTDEKSGAPLPNANILVKETTFGTVSNNDGEFELSVPIEPPFTLVVSFLGYVSREIIIEEHSEKLEVTLKETFIGTNKIVITASRREQQLMDVPASISVIDNNLIESIPVLNSMNDLAILTPGITGNQFAGTAQIYTIRGIGSDAYGIGSESSVGLFLDEFYVGRITQFPMFLDVERIEVIKGPQSTLFGRNTSAGAISVISNKPKKEKKCQSGDRPWE